MLKSVCFAGLLGLVLVSGPSYGGIVLRFASAVGGQVEVAGYGGHDYFKWTESEPIPTEPSAIYGFSLSARAIGRGRMAFGTRDAFVEMTAPDVSWYEKRHVFRTASRPGTDRARLGTVSAEGAFSFKDIAVRKLTRRFFEKDGLVLGHGESLVGNDYGFATVFESTSRGDSRCLVDVDTCRFRQCFWDLRQGGSVTWSHALGGRSLASGRVELHAAWGEGGELFADASSDGGKTWTTLGAVPPQATTAFDIPSGLFPAKDVRVRLRCTKGTMFQVTQYVFSGKVDGAPTLAYGWTKYLDAETGALFAEVKAPPFTEPVGSENGVLLATPKGAAVWSAVSDVKVFRTTPRPENRADGIRLTMAANESESVQVVVASAEADIRDVRVTASLADAEGNRLPEPAVRVSRVGYVPVRVPSDEAGACGLWPDPLLPQDKTSLDVKAGENQPFWITVTTTPTTPAGLYRGAVAVSPLGVEIPLEVEVLGFRLQERLTCETAVGLYIDKLAELADVPFGSPAHEAEIEKYLKLFAANRISPFAFGRFMAPDVTGWKGDEPELDWTRFDRWQARLLGEFRCNTLKVPSLPPKLSEARRDRLQAAIGRHLVEKGWAEFAYVYGDDEPTQAMFPAVNAHNAQWKRNAPDLRRMLTKEPLEELRDVDIWCPRLDLFKSGFYPKARARGDGMWWYVCCGPRAPYPCEFIDHAGSEMRTWLWMTWAEKMQGILLWQSIYWGKRNPYEDAMSWATDGGGYGNGDGMFIYPPRAGESDPHPSIRLEQLRDGLEDNEYFAMLKRRSPNHPLLAVPREVFRTYSDFTPNPAPLRRHRAKVAAALAAGSLSLTKGGRVTAEIVVAADAPRPVAFAKRELEKYLGILATNGVGKAKVGGQGQERMVKVSVSVDAGNAELKEDGFVLEADERGVRVIGQNPRGALYGAYEILKRYGGIRWLAPGDDCEYFTLRGDVVVPYGRSVQNPHMKIRVMNSYGSGPASWVWAARNNRVMEANNDWFCDKDGKRTKNCDLLEDCCMAGQGPGGHVICELMYGEFKHEKKARLGRLDKLFKEHPNWFPLVRGKRITSYANPCLQDPALFDHMAKNYLVELRKPHAFDLPVIIGNNDTTVWCECEKCKAMDDESFGPTGKLANRYWYMVNELAKRIWKEIPDARLAGWAYQNFWYPPTTVKPDPRLGVLVSYNNQCWRHSVTEPGCIVNAEMARIYRAWRKMDVAYLWNRAEISCEDAPGTYAPAERTLYNNYREYPSIGCDGDHYCCYAPDWKFMDWAKDTPPYYGHNYRFWAMWQTQWLSSQFMWDINRNFEALYEECNRLYYGVAWEGGMRSFRELLKESFYHGQGCIGWGQHNPLGKCLAWPADAQERLSALLEKAIASAKAAGDERALQHVLRDREIFKLTWIDPYREYAASRRELTAHGRTGEIVVDGVLSEKDWRTAETLGDFRRPYWEETSIRTQKVEIATRAKVVWDKDTLYFAVEAFDPEMDNIRACKPAEVDRNAGWSALGDNIQLFYQSPLMGEKAFQLCVNSEGAVIDGIKKTTTVFDGTFNTKAKVAVRKSADRWTVEVAVPADELGLHPAEGDTWRFNVCRARQRLRKSAHPQPEDRDERLRLTSANGKFYAPSSFVELKFEK